MQKCGGQILFTSKSVGKTWRFKTPAKMCCTFLGKSAGEAGRVFPASQSNQRKIGKMIVKLHALLYFQRFKIYRRRRSKMLSIQLKGNLCTFQLNKTHFGAH